MSCKFCVRCDEVFDECGEKHLVYGIDVFDAAGNVLDSIPDIFDNEKEAQNFARLCNKKELSEVHIRDVVMDIVIYL